MGRPRDNAIRNTKSIEMSTDGMMIGDSLLAALYTIPYSTSL